MRMVAVRVTSFHRRSILSKESPLLALPSDWRHVLAQPDGRAGQRVQRSLPQVGLGRLSQIGAELSKNKQTGYQRNPFQSLWW